MRSHTGQITRSLFSTEAREETALCSLQFFGSIIVLVGFFGPWIAHRTAALTVTGYELSEFAKFFPQIQSGAVPVRRALFVTPLLAGLASLVPTIHRSIRVRPVRLGAVALMMLLGLAVLPPVQAISERQHRLQLGLVMGGIALSGVAPLVSHLSERLRGALLLLLAFGGAIPSMWQAILLRPLVVELYGRPVWPGWGLVACTTGFLVLMAAGLRTMAKG